MLHRTNCTSLQAGPTASGPAGLGPWLCGETPAGKLVHDSWSGVTHLKRVSVEMRTVPSHREVVGENTGRLGRHTEQTVGRGPGVIYYCVDFRQRLWALHRGSLALGLLDRCDGGQAI